MPSAMCVIVGATRPSTEHVLPWCGSYLVSWCVAALVAAMIEEVDNEEGDEGMLWLQDNTTGHQMPRVCPLCRWARTEPGGAGG